MDTSPIASPTSRTALSARSRMTAPSSASRRWSLGTSRSRAVASACAARSRDMLVRGLQLVDRQTPMTGDGYLDLLAVDGDGRLVVPELETPYAAPVMLWHRRCRLRLRPQCGRSGGRGVARSSTIPVVATSMRIDDFIAWYEPAKRMAVQPPSRPGRPRIGARRGLRVDNASRAHGERFSLTTDACVISLVHLPLPARVRHQVG